MSDPFIAEIKIFAGNFAPRGWAFCDGQLLPIAQNTALFSLIGTIYGGDGRTTTALPNLQGRAPMHPGRGPGLTPRAIGQRGGTEQETLSVDQMPSHNHSIGASTSPASSFAPTSNSVLSRSVGAAAYDQNDDASNQMAPEVVGNTGGAGAHNNMQPFITLNYIIALVGTFPSRS